MKALPSFWWITLSVSARKTLELVTLLQEAPGNIDLDALESSLVSMAREGGTPSLHPFISQVEKLTSGMKEGVMKQSKSSQKELDASWQDFLSCTVEQQKMPGLQAASLVHRTCRTEESQMYKDLMSLLEICHIKNSTADAYCDAFTAMDQFPSAGNCKWQNAAPQTSALRYMKLLRDGFLEKHNAWLQNKSLCDGHTNHSDLCFADWRSKQLQLEQKRAECDRYQGQLEILACGSHDCSDYTNCYSTRRSSWESTNATVAMQEASFLAEYRGLLRIECLLSAFRSSLNYTTPLSQGIDECRRTDFKKSSYLQPLYINYFDGSQNSMKACFPGTGPSSQAWSEKYYAHMPMGTKAAVCTADCCTTG